jgi:hypothetical protein
MNVIEVLPGLDRFIPASNAKIRLLNSKLDALSSSLNVVGDSVSNLENTIEGLGGKFNIIDPQEGDLLVFSGNTFLNIPRTTVVDGGNF